MARQRRERAPWSDATIRRKGGRIIAVPCPRCGRRTAIRYWDPALGRGVCEDHVPPGILRPQADSPPDQRPMALGD